MDRMIRMNGWMNRMAGKGQRSEVGVQRSGKDRGLWDGMFSNLR